MNNQSQQYFSKECLNKENIIDVLRNAYNLQNSVLQNEALTFIE